MIISATHSPLSHAFFVKNETLIKEHPWFQQFVGAMADVEKSGARREAELRVLQFGLSRIAALAMNAERAMMTPVDLRQNLTKVSKIAEEIQKGLEDIARAYG